MSAPMVFDFPSVGGELLDDLSAIIYARLSGEDELHFAARLTRLQCATWLNAHRDLENARLNGNCRETLRKFEKQERQARHTLNEYTRQLVEALTPKAA